MREAIWCRGFSQNVQRSTCRPVLREELMGVPSYLDSARSRLIGADQIQKREGRIPRLRHTPLTLYGAFDARICGFFTHPVQSALGIGPHDNFIDDSKGECFFGGHEIVAI